MHLSSVSNNKIDPAPPILTNVNNEGGSQPTTSGMSSLFSPPPSHLLQLKMLVEIYLILPILLVQLFSGPSVG
jgi:hypothetical protein